MNRTTVRLPDGVIMCWCGMLFQFPADADRCDHRPPVPIVPGLVEQLPPLAGTSPGRVYAPGRRRARRRALLTLIAIALTLVGLFALQAAADPGTGGPRSTPTTHATPGPRGGAA